MNILALLLLLLPAIAYSLLLAGYYVGWKRQPIFDLSSGYEPVTFLSVIVPARNEAANIGACLKALQAQQYPVGLFEVIVVDDHSTDGTASIVAQYAADNLHCINLANHLEPGKIIRSYKKAALAAGIAHSSGALIITTDADCTASDTWLLHIAALYEQQHPAMIVAPVAYQPGHTVLSIFQYIDFMSMQGITVAAHQLRLGHMSNGANLAFSRAAYNAAGGYAGIDHLASGDDYLLLLKVARLLPGKIAYLKAKQAIVATLPQPSWRSFLQQRIRWASKTGKYSDPRLTTILVFVYCFNLCLLVLSIMGIWYPLLLAIAVLSLTLKTVAELVFLWPVAGFFGGRKVLPYFALLQPLHILYIIAAGFMGFVGKYQWKGRTVK